MHSPSSVYNVQCLTRSFSTFNTHVPNRIVTDFKNCWHKLWSKCDPHTILLTNGIDIVLYRILNIVQSFKCETRHDRRRRSRWKEEDEATHNMRMGSLACFIFNLIRHLCHRGWPNYRNSIDLNCIVVTVYCRQKFAISITSHTQNNSYPIRQMLKIHFYGLY